MGAPASADAGELLPAIGQLGPKRTAILPGSLGLGADLSNARLLVSCLCKAL